MSSTEIAIEADSPYLSSCYTFHKATNIKLCDILKQFLFVFYTMPNYEVHRGRITISVRSETFYGSCASFTPNLILSRYSVQHFSNGCMCDVCIDKRIFRRLSHILSRSVFFLLITQIGFCLFLLSPLPNFYDISFFLALNFFRLSRGIKVACI